MIRQCDDKRNWSVDAAMVARLAALINERLNPATQRRVISSAALASTALIG